MGEKNNADTTQKILGVPQYISPEQYSELTAKGYFGEKSKLGVERIKELCEDGVLPYVKTRGGQYRIKVYDDVVPIEKYNEIKDRCTKLETTLKSINKLATI